MDYQLLVIGAGPGGYVAAIRAAQLGMSVACIESRGADEGTVVPGGTCLNVGCIPSKALLDSSQRFASAQHQAAEHGIQVGELALDLSTMMQRKNQVVQRLGQGVTGLLRAAGVEVLPGRAQLLPQRRVQVQHGGQQRTLQAEHVILACGSVPMELPIAPVDGKRVLDSTGALSLDKLPKRLGVIGAGVIGLELGSVWSRLGTEVVLLEALETFLPELSRRVARETEKILRAQGLDIRLGARVEGAESKGRGVTVNFSDAAGSQSERFDYLVVAVGRRPATEDLLAEGCGVQLEENGMIRVDEYCRTDAENVHAIGDVVRGPMLAHKSSEEGMMVVERIAGKKTRINYDCIPSVIYTHPELAWVGPAIESLQEQGVECKRGEFPFAASGRALAAGESEGVVELAADAGSDRLLSCHVVGHGASELVQQAVIAMEFSASAEDLALTVFAHPTFSEALHEAALAVDGRAIHIARKRTARKGS